MEPRARSSSSPWAWLLIGLLLGTGGTLLTSTFWLPERESGGLSETTADDQQLSTDDEAVATVLDPAVNDLEEGDRSSDDDAVDEPEIVAVVPEVETADSEPPVDNGALVDDGALEPQLPTDGEGDIAPDQIELADGSESLLEAEASAQPGDEAVVDENQNQAALGEPRPSTEEPEEPFLRPEEALETLVSASSQTLDGDGSERPDVSDEVDRRQPAPKEPAERVAVEEVPSVEEPVQEAVDEAPSNGADPAVLPLRIRQALQSADTGTGEGTGEDGASRDRVYRVQLAAVNDEAAARVYWREVNDRLPGVFTDVEPVFDQRVVGERLFLRIWVGAFDSRTDAVGYCDWLKEQGQDCFVTRASDL